MVRSSSRSWSRGSLSIVCRSSFSISFWCSSCLSSWWASGADTVPRAGAAGLGVRGTVAEKEPVDGSFFIRRSRSPIGDLLSEQRSQQALPAQTRRLLRQEVRNEPFDVLSDPRPRRDLGEEDAPVDGVDQQEKVIADRVGERLSQ